ncbi:zinc-binding dehydrogenase [uncultured Aeromicrobium sp.]|uniref:zinc-dependent alcohol dehydrogenase n=1 Tax=uncultured Aeromicrobium sp. TaxID=337820 RepID=UPI0025E66BF8|nr:alcohol dehydrogenase catalytic domain-containing protein [uncultured Aeromicrobium sp.]
MPRTVRALRLHRDLVADVAAIDAPALRDGEVRIRTAAAGICGSDVHAAQTGAWIEYWPATTGHEVAGTVVESSSDALAVGERVVVDSRIPCRACEDCAHAPRLCAHLTWLGESRPGGFAEELTVPASDVYIVGDAFLPLDVAVLAEPLAVVLTALRAVPADTRTVLIQGYGPIGALAHLVLRGRGIEVAASEPNPARLADAVTRGASAAPPAPQRVDVVLDAAGYRGSVAAAFDAVRRGGTVIVVAIGDHPIDISAQALVEKGVSILTSVGFDDDGIPAALDVLAADPLAFADVVSDRIALDELPPHLTAPPSTRGKVVVTFP